MITRRTCLLLLMASSSVFLVKVALTLAQGSRGVFTQGTRSCYVNRTLNVVTPLALTSRSTATRLVTHSPTSKPVTSVIQT